MENIPIINSNPIFQGRAVTSSPQAQPSMASFVFNPSMSSSSSLADLGEKFGAFVKNPIVQGAGSLIGSLINNYAEDRRAQIQRQWNEDMLDKQNAFSLDMWNKANEYNSPYAQKQRLINAGLNPLNYGLDGNSTNAFESASPLGYDRASNPQGISNPFGVGFDTVLAQKQIEATDAHIAKTKSDTKGSYLDNQFKEDTLASREEGVELANNATKETIAKIREEKNKALKEIELLIKQASTEDERKILVAAQSAVQKATEKQILQLLPVQQKLMEAQTLAQQAAAAANFASAAYQNGLIDAGQIDEICRKAKADADDAEAKAAIDEFAAACKTGNPYIINENDSKFSKGAKKALNSVAREIQVFGSVLKPIAVGTNIAAKGITSVAKTVK